MAFNRPGATWAVALDIPSLSAQHDMLVFFINSILTKFQVRYLAAFCFFSVIDSFMWFWMVSLHKSIQFDEVPHGSILAPKLFWLYIDDLLDYFICNIAFYAADTTL